MNTCFRVLCFLIFSFFSFLPAKATHLIGGDISYVCLGDGEYEVILNLYRDCSPNNTTGSTFDNSATIRVYNATTGLYTNFVAPFDGVITDVELESNDSCVFIPEELCIEKGTYHFSIDIPDSTQSYFVNYQRCCFGPTVGNIEDSEDMGINISALIPPSSFASCYSSPTFNNTPLLTLCLSNPISEDLGATSSLGMPGTLEYSFFTPYAGASSDFPLNYNEIPFTPMTWSSGYSSNYPIESNPAIDYNSSTGELTGVVTELGYYLMGTRVEIKDNFNNVVGSIERVFKYTIADCSAGEHIVEIESELGPFVQLCSGDEYTFEVAANATTDSLFWTVNGVQEAEGPTLEYTFGQDGVYDVVLHGIADSSECYTDGSFNQSVTVFNLEPAFKAKTYICAGEVNKFVDTTFIPSGIIYEKDEWFWTFGDGQSSSSETPEHVYTQPGIYDVSLQVRMNNGCIETIVREDYVEVYEVNLDFESINGICVNNSVPFTSSVIMPIAASNPVKTYLWDFGDGETSDEANPVHTYTSVGMYDVSLQVELESGCSYYIEYPGHIDIYDDYIDVDLDVVTDTLAFPFSNPLSIQTTTNNFDSIAWFLNGEYISNAQDLLHLIGEEYNEEYIHVEVEYFEGSCSMTDELYIPAVYTNNLFIPNAFTPNGDNVNEGFKPLGRVVDHAILYNFVIYNRFGQQYFNSSDKEEAWMGDNMDGVEVDQGIYVWTLDIITKHSGSYSKQGVVVLIK